MPTKSASDSRPSVAMSSNPPARGRYDPSRVTEAAGDQPRMYQRENGSIMRLNRGCARCGEQHFDFEHAYIQEGARAFPLVVTSDYEVVDSEDGSDFA
ncbi:hypothetical protein CF319_g7232 [Tilletia indica]|uniref:Uncharacterized protein n=1 Tax=Tilletia indica TaxID=43049 RepID=A0A8T8SWP8_9BASI|nr:hypothetical protein CF319_g7232 [Tilletia indica]KAE8249859.1 hypothetical protein A4X13_0g5043 [Tilletia indica]